MKNKLINLRKSVLRAFLFLMVFVVPIQAFAFDCASCYWNGYQSGYAGACSECAAVFQQLTDLINQSTQAINQNIDGTRDTLSNKIDTATNAIVAAIEKQSAAEQQLKQTEINYKAATDSGKAGSAGDDMFTQPAADLMDPSVSANACATMATATAATTAANNASITARALTAADARKSLYTTNASGVMQQEIKTYKDNFCSDKAAARGICTQAQVAPSGMQDADVNAGSLLAPVAGGTYSDDEMKAARQYVSNVMGPISSESLPIVMEKSPAGQRYLLEQRAMGSVQSMASFSLNHIFSNHSAEDTSSSAAAGQKISIVGLMKKFVEDRFGSPSYRDSLATLNEVGLLRQIAENIAFQNWMDYYQYQQGERTEGLLATTLALNARDRSERSLAALRQQASSSGR